MPSNRMFRASLLLESDYDNYLLKWWKDNRFPAPPRDFLPNNGKGGVMVLIEDVPICAGFVYHTNSNVAWIEFIVSNFEIKDKTIRKEALNYLIQNLIVLANSKYIFSSVKNPSLINHFKNNGFVVGSKGTTEMVFVNTSK